MIEKGLWLALSGAVAVVTLAVFAGVLLLVIPASILQVAALIRGALRL
ncbi:hypothetical protein [Pseudomonas aeruginosa]|nr:hypothetical protein [Pseudomonas aeruginosa]